jgi:Family of unknown function (DUF6058)
VREISKAVTDFTGDKTIRPIGISLEDDAYIRSHFVDLDWLAKKSGVDGLILTRWQEQSLFPQPTYVTEDGLEWYPPPYAELIRRAAARKIDLKALFKEDFLCALERLRHTDPGGYRGELAGPGGTALSPEEDVELNWQGFVSGEFGACLRMAWVPCMLRKGKLMRTIEELAAKPALDDANWRRRLRRAVDSLDRLEMPFAHWDRVRFGKPVSRDTHIQAIRQRFPDVFGLKADRSGDVAPLPEILPPEELPC